MRYAITTCEHYLGIPLSADFRYCPTCLVPTRPTETWPNSLTFCESCHSMLVPGAAYCHHCGTPQSA